MDSSVYSWSWSAKWAFPVGFALGVSVAFAQETPAVAGTKLTYLSVFSQYKAFKEQPVSSWKETNDTVGKIGGWRVYAKEARLPETDGKAATASSKAEIQDGHGRTP